MTDFPLTLRVRLPTLLIEFTHKVAHFATGVENKATGDQKLVTALPMQCLELHTYIYIHVHTLFEWVWESGQPMADVDLHVYVRDLKSN